MGIFDGIKSFFGFKPNNHYDYNDRPRIPHNNLPDSWNFDEDNGAPPEYGRGFSIFSDPLEMHRYFEQQMGEMLRTFGFHGGFDNGGFFGGGGGGGDGFPFGGMAPPGFGGVPPPLEGDNNGSDLRDQFLKPGYDNGVSNGRPTPKADGDLDGKLNMGDLNSILDGDQSSSTRRSGMMPFSNRGGFFGQSVVSKTIQKPDGSIETQKTVRDSHGNEETTVTIRKGGQEYTVTKRRDKNGEEQTTEDIINMDENDVDRILKSPPNLPPFIGGGGGGGGSNRPHPPNWFPRDDFFK